MNDQNVEPIEQPEGNPETGVVLPEKKTIRKERNTVRVKGSPDIPLIVSILMLVGFGLAMVYSASFPLAEHDHQNSYYYLIRQLAFAAVGIVVMIVAGMIDYKKYFGKATPAFFAVSFLMLASVPIIGETHNGAKRWIGLGLFSFQPTEIMKLALVMMLAWYISKYVHAYRDFDEKTKAVKNKSFMKRKLSERFPIFVREVVIPFAILGSVCAITLLEKHLSGTIILFVVGWLVMLWGRISLPWLLGILGGGGLAAWLFATLTGYTSDRITAWLDPYADELGSGWQIIQGFNAIGSGGLFGVGYTNSTLKHLYLPEPQNDYIFAIVCEEFGFIGAVLLIVLFAVFAWRGFVVAAKAPDSFSRLTAAGITCKICVQTLLNIFVVTGLFPPTGISLPFISYGGTALVILLAECGVLISISRYSRQKKV
ncbi:MAG: cell division protein FtsW [Clostridia bacterium]|nr:cell division protein FtsW [Clostridia bacterium]MBQ3870873.1 cell division protein FtsW [Clostridia bacterium]